MPVLDVTFSLNNIITAERVDMQLTLLHIDKLIARVPQTNCNAHFDRIAMKILLRIGCRDLLSTYSVEVPEVFDNPEKYQI